MATKQDVLNLIEKYFKQKIEELREELRDEPNKKQPNQDHENFKKVTQILHCLLSDTDITLETSWTSAFSFKIHPDNIYKKFREYQDAHKKLNGSKHQPTTSSAGTVATRNQKHDEKTTSDINTRIIILVKNNIVVLNNLEVNVPNKYYLINYIKLLADILDDTPLIGFVAAILDERKCTKSASVVQPGNMINGLMINGLTSIKQVIVLHEVFPKHANEKKQLTRRLSELLHTPEDYIDLTLVDPTLAGMVIYAQAHYALKLLFQLNHNQFFILANSYLQMQALIQSPRTAMHAATLIHSAEDFSVFARYQESALLSILTHPNCAQYLFTKLFEKNLNVLFLQDETIIATMIKHPAIMKQVWQGATPEQLKQLTTFECSSPRQPFNPFHDTLLTVPEAASRYAKTFKTAQELMALSKQQTHLPIHPVTVIADIVFSWPLPESFFTTSLQRRDLTQVLPEHDAAIAADEIYRSISWLPFGSQENATATAQDTKSDIKVDTKDMKIEAIPTVQQINFPFDIARLIATYSIFEPPKLTASDSKSTSTVAAPATAATGTEPQPTIAEIPKSFTFP